MKRLAELRFVLPGADAPSGETLVFARFDGDAVWRCDSYPESYTLPKIMQRLEDGDDDPARWEPMEPPR